MSAHAPVRLLIVIGSLETGGVQRLVTDLLRHFDRRRIEPVLVVSSRAGAMAAAVPADCRVHDLGRRGTADFPALVVRLARVLRAERPAVVLAAQFHGNVLALAARAAAGLAMPVMISEHVSVESYRHGPAWVRALMRATYRYADAAIAVSSGVARELTDEWRVPAEKVRVVSNPIDIDAIEEQAVDAVDATFGMDEPVITSVGRLTPQKGFSHLLRAFALVRQEQPAKLVIIGDGEERIRLEQLAGELGVAPYVTWIRHETNPYRWMARSSVFVLASLYEGFGIVLTEAMALGVPVIAADCPHGPAEILRGGRDGLLVPPGDERALADALSRLLGDAALRTTFAAAGRARARDFAIAPIAREYEALCGAVPVARLAVSLRTA